MPVTLDAIGIVTADLAKSLQFYSLLGVQVPTELSDHVEATLQNGLRIMWDDLELIKQIMPDWVPPVGHRIGLAFHCQTPTEVDQTYQDLVKAGFNGSKEPWDAFWGQRYAQIADPDGNIIDLFAPLN
jgi:uncharacterized glyoxalase superfamily protein PhnB